MTDEERDDEKSDDGLAPEVPTTFATKGLGWSGREGDDVQEVESETPPQYHSFRKSTPAGG